MLVSAPAALWRPVPEAPGTALGSAAARVTTQFLPGTEISLAGRVLVGSPSDHAIVAAACGVAPPFSVWLLELAASTGQTLAIPLFLDRAGGAVRLHLCLPPPDVPEELGGAPLGVKLVHAELGVSLFPAGVPRGRHVWSGLFTPYLPGTGIPGTAVEARAIQPLPARVTLTRRLVGARRASAVLSGRLLEAGSGSAGARAELWRAGNARGRGARRVAAATTSTGGRFSFRRRVTATGWYAVRVPPRDVTGRECGGPTAPGGCVSALVASAASRLVKVSPPRRR